MWTSNNEWIKLTYFIKTEKNEPIKSKNFKSFDYLDCHNYDRSCHAIPCWKAVF